MNSEWSDDEVTQVSPRTFEWLADHAAPVYHDDVVITFLPRELHARLIALALRNGTCVAVEIDRALTSLT